MLRLSARLPDALIGLAPDLGCALGLRLDQRPQAAGETLAVDCVLEDRVEHGPVDVVLALVEGAVADPHRAGAGVAREILAEGLGEIAAAVDPIHDLQPAVAVGLKVGHELHELVGLPVEAEEVQGLERERGVAHPGEAVIPVALAARRLGQRGRQRGDSRSRRHVREPLDGQRRALDRLPPAMVPKRTHPVKPAPPEAHRGVDLRGRLVDVGRSSQMLTPGQACVGPLAGGQGVAGAHAVGLDPQLEIGHQADRLAGAGGVGGVAAAVGQLPLARRATVVEGRLADQLDLDLALQAAHGSHEDVLRVLVGRRPGVRRDPILVCRRAHDQRVVDLDPPAGCLPGRHQHVGAGLVEPPRRNGGPERSQSEHAGLAIEQRPEHAGRVEARNAQPVDRPVGRDERAGVAVGQERVVGDGREWRRSRRALRGPLSRGPGLGAGACPTAGALALAGGAHDATHGSCQRPTPATS